MQRKYVVHSLRNDSKPCEGATASGNVSSRVQTMLDPFLGIGNSAVAAQRSGVKKFVGFEIDKTYLAEAKRRLAL